MSAAPTSLDTIRARRLGDIGDDALLWLALPPAWTAPLAAACDFPAGSQPARAFFESAVRDGLALSDQPVAPAAASTRPVASKDAAPATAEPVKRAPDLSGYDASLLADLGLAATAAAVEPTFWAAPGTRSDILTRTLSDRARGQAAVRETVGLIGARIQQASGSAVKPGLAALPAPTRRWAELAAALRKGPRAAAALLDTTLESLLRPDKANTDEALRWIEAATSLAELFGGDLLAAVQRGGRRLELFHRRDFDRRHLGRFLERGEQVQSFTDLLVSPPEEWALHYIGLGGVGKTMLVRYLTLLLTDDERFKGRAACARVDFDHLSPEYPARAPGLLLENLATELVLYGQGPETTRAFARFQDYVTTLHEGLPPPVLGAPPALPTGDEQFLEVLRVFIEALRTLPQPVVFILDTCEELARISAEGEAPLNVRATFAILEQMQAVAQRAGVQVRVIFCGRRPLASAGAGWQWPTARPLPVRPYLRIHAIRGFTHDEARTFLTARAGVPAEPAARLAAIIERSPEYGRLDGLIFTDPSRAPAEAPRCSPFDLDLYAAWVREVPDLDAQTIRTADADQYIDLRIMGRLQPTALRDLMPAVALLGRFDLPMLAAALGDGQPKDAGFSPPLPAAASDPPAAAGWLNLFEALARQEWMDRQDPFLEVDRLLLPKLRAYFMRRNEEALDLAARRAGLYLRQMTLRAQQSELSVTHLDNALRLTLSDNPAVAADWWSQIEQRFAHPEAWPWLETVCDRLLGRGGAVGTFRPNDWWRGQPLSADAQAEWQEGRAHLQAEGNLDGSDSALRAAVLATYNAARLQQRRLETLYERWQEAQAILSETPQPAPPLLHLRAVAGCLAAAPSADLAPAQRAAWQAQLRALVTPELAADPQALAALLAVAETDQAPLTELLTQAAAVSADTPLELYAWASLLIARGLSAAGQKPDALAQARQALRLIHAGPAQSPAQSNAPAQGMAFAQASPWLDWLPPADLAARIRLEFILLAYPALLSPPETLREVGEELPTPGTLDADRLGARLLELQAASAPPALDLYAALALPAVAAGERLAAVHRMTPPLFAALAVAQAQAGRVDDALAALRQTQTQTESAVNLAGQQATLLAQITIIRQFRLRDLRLGAEIASGLVSQTVYPELQPHLLASLGLAAPAAGTPPVPLPTLPHLTWRSTPIFTPADFEATAAIPIAPAQPDADEVVTRSFDAAALLLDQQERAYLAAQWNLATSNGAASPPIASFTAAAWERSHPYQPIEALTLHLRAAALAASSAQKPSNLSALVGQIGVRRAAWLALDEGELLALRLPARAVPILEQAAAWAAESQDPILGFLVQAALALTCARAGQRQGLEQALKEVESLLARLPLLQAARIAWSDLAAAAVSGDINQAGGFMNKAPRWPRGWQPWLVRVVAAQAALLVMRNQPSGLPQILDWVAANYGALGAESADQPQAQKTRLLPPELQGLQATAASGAGEENQPPRSRLAGAFSSANLLLMLGFAILALLVGGLYWLYSNGLDWVLSTTGFAPGPEVGTPARIGLFVALLIALALVTRLPAVVRRWLRATSAPQLTLSLEKTADVRASLSWRQPPPVQMTYTAQQVHLQAQWPILTRQRQTLVRATSAQTTFESYQATAVAALPSALVTRLRADQKALGSSRYDMQLIVERNLAAVGWEGLLAGALESVEPPRLAPMDFWRSVPGARPPSEPAKPPPPRVLVLFDSFEQQALALTAWEPARHAGIAVETASLADDNQGESALDATIIHLIARPLRTTTGVRWQIQAGEAAYTQVKSQPRSRILDSNELLSRYPAMRIAILQAPTAESRDPRSEAQYDDAAMLRELAADLALAGVGLVLTAPALLQEAFSASWQPLNEALIEAQRAGGLPAAPALRAEWQLALAQARQVIAASYEGAAKMGFEAAWDFCLYAAEP